MSAAELLLSASEAERFRQHETGEFVTVVDTPPTKPCPEPRCDRSYVPCEHNVPCEPGDVVTITGPCPRRNLAMLHTPPGWCGACKRTGRVSLGVGTITNIEPERMQRWSNGDPVVVLEGPRKGEVCYVTAYPDEKPDRYRVTLTDVERTDP